MQVDYALLSSYFGLRRSGRLAEQTANKRGLGEADRTAANHRLVRANIALCR